MGIPTHFFLQKPQKPLFQSRELEWIFRLRSINIFRPSQYFLYGRNIHKFYSTQCLKNTGNKKMSIKMFYFYDRHTFIIFLFLIRHFSFEVISYNKPSEGWREGGVRQREAWETKRESL